MATFSSNIVNQRFRIVYETLLKTKKIKNKQEMAKTLET